MISKERLQKLIEEEKNVYYIDIRKKIIPYHLDKTDEIIHYKDDTALKLVVDNYKDSFWVCNLYASEEEAQFVADNHTTRVERFEPPFELKEYENYEFISQNYDVGTCHIRHLNGYHVCNYDNYVYKFFDTYQEAVAYARKLFDGEE